MGFQKTIWLAARADALFFFEVLRLLDRLVGESLLVGHEGFFGWLAVWRYSERKARGGPVRNRACGKGS